MACWFILIPLLAIAIALIYWVYKRTKTLETHMDNLDSLFKEVFKVHD